MLKGESNNPLYEHFTRNSGWPSMKQTRWLAIWMVLVCTILMAWPRSDIQYRQLLNSLNFLSILVVSSPLLFAIYAVSLADRLINGFDHQMIRLTHLTESDILDGFVLIAIFRLRVPLAIITGLAPVVSLLFIIYLRVIFTPNPVAWGERLLTVFFGFAFAVVVWILQRISIFFGVNAIFLGQPRHLAFLTTGVVVLFVLALLYFVTGLAAFALAVWVTLMTTVVF